MIFQTILMLITILAKYCFAKFVLIICRSSWYCSIALLNCWNEIYSRVAILLLQVLGVEPEAFGPQNFERCGHGLLLGWEFVH